jgi:tetratricopeptide (TPR) repeat protein
MSSAAILTSRRALRCARLATCLILFASATANAQEATAAETDAAATKAEAASLFGQALAAYDRGEITEAIEKLRSAHAIAPSAKVLYNLALFEVAAGQRIQAVADFERYLASDDAAQSPARQQSVRRMLQELRQQLAQLQIRTEPAVASVMIDGSDAERVMLLEPGTHRLLVKAEGFLPSEFELTLGVGDNTQVVVQLSQSQPAAPTAPSAASRPAFRSPPPTRAAMASPGWPARAWAIVLIGAGAALAAGAATSYIVGANEEDDWSSENERLDSVEPAARDDAYWLARAKNAERSRTIRQLNGMGIGLLIGAAASATAGVGIWLSAPRSSQSRAAGVSLSGTW